VRKARSAAFAFSCLLVARPVVVTAFGPRLSLPVGVRAAGAVLAVAAAILACLSLFFEVRTHRVYLGGPRRSAS